MTLLNIKNHFIDSLTGSGLSGLHVVCISFLCLFPRGDAYSQNLSDLEIQPQEKFVDPSEVSVKGILGDAISTSGNGRLLTLPHWHDGELIKMFSRESRNNNDRTDWYGEHAGKWMYSTALAANRTGNEYLKTLLLQTADYLVSTQEEDGYLGSYSSDLRITNKNSKSHGHSWDVWTLSYMTLGLLQVNRFFPGQKYLNAAKKIGELFLKTFGDGSANITDYGTRHGISATIILDPVVELYKITSDKRYLDFAQLIIKEMEEKEGVRLISVALHNQDMENVGDGKAYQIIWNLTAVAKLYEVTGNPDYLKATENAWQNIVDSHLTISGGPWGGIGKHYECFNRKGFWDPYGFIETCSTMSWIQFNKEMLYITGEAKYAQEIERSAYNALLGAQYPDGQNWCYHSFTNGRRHIAHFNDCCPSSGALALEELSPLIYTIKDGGIACNLFSENEATITLVNANPVQINQKTDYPFDGNIQLTVRPSKRAEFPIFIRIPDWANGTAISVNGEPVDAGKIQSGTYFRLDRKWAKENTIEINFPFDLKIHQKIEQATVPQGNSDIYKVDWFALTRGPLVYATNGLINGEDRERVFQLSPQNPETLFKQVASLQGMKGQAYALKIPGKEPLLFVPLYEAGGRSAGTWRLTWVQYNIDH